MSAQIGREFDHSAERIFAERLRYVSGCRWVGLKGKGTGWQVKRRADVDLVSDWLRTQKSVLIVMCRGVPRSNKTDATSARRRRGALLFRSLRQDQL